MPLQCVDPDISGVGHGADSLRPGLGGEPVRLQELGNKQRELLDVISSIQDIQSFKIKLPQIVVVGEQSAGKSSALEAITGIPFTKNAAACTRYPTEIRLKKADIASYRVWIIPDKRRDLETRKRLDRFGTRLNENMPFGELFKAASTEITSNSNGFATRDTLVIEWAGKDKPHLTLVDLPGLVRIPNNEQSATDIAEIAALTDEYMKNRRALILAVIGCNSDYVQADILEKVRQFDPKRSRTIGVLTKPDMVTSQALQVKFLTLVKNQDGENRLKLGWHILRNPGDGELWNNREKEDTFFLSPPWNALAKDMTRAKALANRLSEQLARHIASYIPKLKEQVHQKLEACKEAQNALGEELDDDNKIRHRLTILLNQSAIVTRNATHAHYANDFGLVFFTDDGSSDNPPYESLRSRVVLANEQFAKDLRTKGHLLGFTCDSSNVETQLKDSELKMNKRRFATTNVANMIAHNRGSHLDGDTSHHVPYLLARDHSRGWKALADGHLEKIDSICKEFVGRVLAKLWPLRMHDPLRQHLLDAGMEACRSQADEQVKKLAEDHNFEVQPYNPIYKKQLDEWSAKNLSPAENTDEHLQPFGHADAELVLEKSLILYDILAETFIRNVIVQAVERGFMRGLPTIFGSEKLVSPEMTDQKLRQIAGDNPKSRQSRLQLKEQATKLKEAYSKIDSLLGKFENSAAFDEGIADSSDSGDEGDGSSSSDSRSNAATVPSSTQESPNAPPAADSTSYRSSSSTTQASVRRSSEATSEPSHLERSHQHMQSSRSPRSSSGYVHNPTDQHPSFHSQEFAAPTSRPKTSIPLAGSAQSPQSKTRSSMHVNASIDGQMSPPGGSDMQGDEYVATQRMASTAQGDDGGIRSKGRRFPKPTSRNLDEGEI